MKTLEITTAIPCKTKCGYCPQDLLKSNYKSDIYEFTVDSFADIIKNAHLMNGVKSIHFSGFCEPLQNELFYRMYGFVSGVFNIKVFTNLLHFSNTAKDAKFLKCLDSVKFYIHIINSIKWVEKTNLFLEFMGNEVDVEFIKVGDENLKLFINDFLIRSGHTINYQPVSSRAGNCYESSFNFKAPLKCRDNRTEQNVVLPNGDLHICCMDYELKYKIGNLLTDSMDDIRQRKLSFYENMRLSEDPNFICKKCFRAVEI